MWDTAIGILKTYKRLSEKYQKHSDEYCRLTTVGAVKGNDNFSKFVDFQGKGRDYYLMILAIYIYCVKQNDRNRKT